MASKEIHIDGRFQLFGNFYHACVYDQHSNPFWKTHRTFMQAASDPATMARLQDWNELNAMGIFAADAQDNKYIPLKANVVIPDGVGTAPYPVAVLIHGQAISYDMVSNSLRETLSYRGYRYLQEYLAEKGVASVSVNVNVANKIGGEGDFQPVARLQISFLILSLLNQLNTPLTSNNPVLLKKANNSLVPLNEGLVEDPDAGSTSPERLLQGLKTDLAGKLDFTKLGFMGHSRSGVAILLVQPFFSARVGTNPTNWDTAGPTTNPYMSIPSGPYNQGTAGNSSYQMHQHQYHYTLNLMAGLGNPTMDVVKTLVALQPGGQNSLISARNTFCLVVASSHDEDVQETAVNRYEDPDCPKALVFSHGASHGRFNTVWRQLRDTRNTINRQIICQSPIRMLSNAGHENLCKATVGNAFLAGLLGENHRYGFFTGEIRATSLQQDITRAWKFPFPFGTPPAFVRLDGTAITATLNSNGTTVNKITQSSLPILRKVNNHEVYVNEATVFGYTRSAVDSMTIRIPIVAGDSFGTRTHFSFRFAKEYDCQTPSARNNLNFRNYSLRLKAGGNLLGVEVAGSAVPSVHQAAYPTKDWDGSLCNEATKIVLQTSEVPLTQFLSSGQPVSDLSRVDSVEIVLQGTAGASGNETWFFNDVLLTTRSLPAAPAGFVIP